MLWELELYVGALIVTLQFGEVWRLIKFLWKGVSDG
jgi:hypothetical protein